jgi:hypothetical protein
MSITAPKRRTLLFFRKRIFNYDSANVLARVSRPRIFQRSQRSHAGPFNENSIRIKVSNLQFEILTFINMKITVFWDVLRFVFVRKLQTFRMNLVPLSSQFSNL